MDPKKIYSNIHILSLQMRKKSLGVVYTMANYTRALKYQMKMEMQRTKSDSFKQLEYEKGDKKARCTANELPTRSMRMIIVIIILIMSVFRTKLERESWMPKLK